MQDLQRLVDNLSYLGYLLSGPQRWITLLDLLLVTLMFFLFLMLVRRSQAALLMRGIIVLMLVLAAVMALLRLPTFNWLLRGLLLVGAVAIPLIFQPELRRGLERLGRSIGFLRLQPTELVHTVVPVLIHSVEAFAGTRTGALIVLEGQASLDEYAATGVPLHAELTSDLLQTIFFENTPLHDGAVIVRESEVVAAACVLPLSDQPLPPGMFQGTRHRAALGISERTDALAIVVSEETGTVSIARDGRLVRHLDSTALRDHLFRFYAPASGLRNGQRGWLRSWRPWRRRPRQPLPPRVRVQRTLNTLATLLVSALLAVMAWLLVGDQVNPLDTAQIAGVPVRAPRVDPSLALMTPLPETVQVTVQAPRDVLQSLQPTSFSAHLEADLTRPGVQRARVIARTGAGLEEVRVVGVDPATVDLELQPVAGRILPVAVLIPDRDSLPFSYQISDAPRADPPQVTITGPAEIVQSVERAEVSIPVQGAKATVQEDRPVVLRDAQGRAVTGLKVEPERVRVTVPIRQAFNTREAAVYPVIVGNVATGYWISNIVVTPTTVILSGDPRTLEQMGGLVDTAPIDVTGAAADIVRRVPLAPPPGVTALNERGVTEGSVEVRIAVAAQPGNLRLAVPVNVTGSTEGVTVNVSPAVVDVYLAGPLPTLNQVAADPQLVRVVVDVTELTSGSYNLTPRVIAPDNVRAQVFPESIEVRVERRVVEPTPSPTPTRRP
ncbi:MAG: diadenylate cyclase CdaA [Caldilineales bacterium]|nr:diadenylate cyclase CdaA [Caldilineales bacterium]MDW8316532.1 diadenylate cyclase CdaA [Anaerolineae bacterium]